MKGYYTGRCPECLRRHDVHVPCTYSPMKGMMLPIYIDELEALVDSLRAELADLNARWPAVNEARDYVLECAQLLAAKDAEIERLRNELDDCQALD